MNIVEGSAPSEMKEMSKAQTSERKIKVVQLD
jgi:hypothetical protein